MQTIRCKCPHSNKSSIAFIINEIRLSRCVPWFHSHNDFPWTDKILQGHDKTICSCLIKDSRSGFLIKNACLLSLCHNNKSSDQHREAPTPFCLYSSRSPLLCCHLSLIGISCFILKVFCSRLVWLCTSSFPLLPPVISLMCFTCALCVSFCLCHFVMLHSALCFWLSWVSLPFWFWPPPAQQPVSFLFL